MASKKRLDGFFKSPRGPSKWPMGRDGRLYIDGTTVQIVAGVMKDYSSITIINNGVLQIVGVTTLGFTDPAQGVTPTLIGCAGDFTINTGGKIEAIENGLDYTNSITGVYSYSRTTYSGVLTGAVVYESTILSGGDGGQSGYGEPGGNDTDYTTGHGGGGGGKTSGLNTSVDYWGRSGDGGESTDAYVTSGKSPYDFGFGVGGDPGYGGETSGQDSFGGGASGGIRGTCGECVYIQIGGIAKVDGVVIYAQGSDGGGGSDGGFASTSSGFSQYGGGGSGGGSGGGGGTIIIRYRFGSISSANCDVSGGLGGAGGNGGSYDSGVTGGSNIDGNPGASGSDGVVGTIDIARY